MFDVVIIDYLNIIFDVMVIDKIVVLYILNYS